MTAPEVIDDVEIGCHDGRVVIDGSYNGSDEDGVIFLTPADARLVAGALIRWADRIDGES